ncbi:MAG: CPBP family intramembrane metalloprotease, partial [Ruminococcus sp.]|nr:CPBP family intramembrane metalloprotease [Ruminococcus sp.]
LRLAEACGFRVTESFRKPQMSAGWIAKWVLIAVGMTYVLSFASNIIFNIIKMLTGVELHAATFSTESTLLDKLVNFFAVVVLAPIFEELLFRASNYRNSMKYGAWSMAIISGLTFGLWHSNYSQTFYTALLGVFSCLMYAKTKSIIPSIITHFCLNLIGGLQLMFIDYSVVNAINAGESVNTGDMLSTLAVMLLFVGIIIGLAITGLVLFIIELVKHRESFHIENELPEVPAVKKTLTYLTAPITILMFLAFIAVTVINALYLDV